MGGAGRGPRLPTSRRCADLKGKTIAATLGTDAYFFLLQALEEAGVGLDEVTIENLQHPDGQKALEGGSVDAWAGLDPMMADAEQNGAKLIYRNVDFASYGTLDATEDFLEEDPEMAQTVVDVYEHARQWIIDNPDEASRSWPRSPASRSRWPRPC